MGGSPSWQIDLPTRKLDKSDESQVSTLPLKSFIPSFGGRSMSTSSNYEFDIREMKQLGLMLSLKLSDGSSNPKETFGEGRFPFSLSVESIETAPLALPTS